MSNSPLVTYVKISPHRTSPRVYPITKITIHHMAGNLTVRQCGDLFQKREACSNYGIDNNLEVGMFCEEKDRAWCSANYDNDHRAINIELANDGGAPDWHVSDAVIEKCIDLCVDICQRNNIEKLIFTGDKTGNLTQHNYFCATACPGPYMKTKFNYIADEVNKRLQGTGEKMYKLKIGYASGGDINTFVRLLEGLGVTYTSANGYINTGWVTSYQKLKIEAKARELYVPCVVTASKGEDPEPEPEPTDEYEEKFKELQNKYNELEATYLKLKKAIEEAEDILYNAIN